MFLFLLCHTVSLPLGAQQHRVDSITRLLQQRDLPDTLRAQHLIHRAMYMEAVNDSAAHRQYREAIDFALGRKLYAYAGMALRYEATPYQVAGKYDQERENLKQAIAHLQRDTARSISKKELGNAYVDLGSHYRRMVDYDQAVEHFLKGISLLEKIGHEDLTVGYANIAAVYQQLKIPERQKVYADKALAAAKRSKRPRSLFTGYLYQLHYLAEIGRYTEAESYLDSARRYFSEDYPFGFVDTYYKLAGVTFQHTGQADSAIRYYEKSVAFSERHGSVWGMVEPLLQIGHIHYGDRRYVQAETYTNRALALAEQDSILIFMWEAYGLMAKITEETGRLQQSIDWVWKHIDVKDTLQNSERKKFAVELEEKYEAEKKENRIQLQEATIKRKDTLNYLLIGSAVALLAILLLGYRNYRHKQSLQQARIDELETDKQLTATEAVLKGEEQERIRLAKDLHDGLGGMLSGIKYSFQNMKGNLIMTPDNAQAFERSIDMLDSSIKEMRRVAHNMMPEALVNFGLDTALRDFCKEIDQSGALQVDYQSIGLEGTDMEQSTAIAVFRIVQELLNNVLKHASATHALVQVTHVEGTMAVTVEDDGIGMDSQLTRQRGGMGWSNIRSRVDYLRGKWDVQTSPEKGTSVWIEFRLTP